MTNDLTSIIASIRRIGADAESVVAALSEHIRNEPDAIRAGPLRRLHQVLQDYVHQSKLALGQFSETSKQSAAMRLAEVDDHLQVIMSSAGPDDQNRNALETMLSTVRKSKAAIA